MSLFTLNVQETVRFYDDDPDARKHSNAVKTVAGEELGLALLYHYLAQAGKRPTRVNLPCTSDGAWLDGWIKVEQPMPVLFQIEVKSWSMHGYGGRKQQLSVNASADTLVAYRKLMWAHYWEAGDFKPKGLRKVLKRMRLPRGETGPVEPIACVWTAVHPDGEDCAFFSVKPKTGDFETVHVFSMSNYLRSIMRSDVSSLQIELPNTRARIAYLNSLFRQLP